MSSADFTEQWTEQIREYHARKTPLQVIGGNSKHFYGRDCRSEASMCTTQHRGICRYEPSELVITARSGTPLQDIIDTLAAQRQMLAFEPPRFSPHSTLGGCIAAGLSGARRPYTGSVRDYVLGVSVINGRGETLRFGGEVMKNVAGYDLARLYTGSLGTLGIITEVSLKVLPQPSDETTQVFESTAQQGLSQLQAWQHQSLPISAACHDGERLYVRLSGSEPARQHACRQLGGTTLNKADEFWHHLNNHSLSFFDQPLPLWRLSLPPATAPLALPGPQLVDWGGAQRWLFSEAPAATVFDLAARLGGHATLFRNGDRTADIFQPLHGKLKELHLNIKLAFDPHGIFNPGRMYADY